MFWNVVFYRVGWRKNIIIRYSSSNQVLFSWQFPLLPRLLPILFLKPLSLLNKGNYVQCCFLFNVSVHLTHWKIIQFTFKEPAVLARITIVTWAKFVKTFFVSKERELIADNFLLMPPFLAFWLSHKCVRFICLWSHTSNNVLFNWSFQRIPIFFLDVKIELSQEIVKWTLHRVSCFADFWDW